MASWCRQMGSGGGRKRKMKKLQDANVQKRTRFIKMAIILFNNKENTRTLLETLEKKRLMHIVNKKKLMFKTLRKFIVK